MATDLVFPDLSVAQSRMTAGEKRLYQRLKAKLSPQSWVWYDQPVGEQKLRPDFIVLHPERGLLVLEVKDWTDKSLAAFDNERVTLASGDVVKNPLEQARQYAFTLVNMLKEAPALRQTGRYAGNLICPYDVGVVLPNMTRRQFEELKLDAVIPPHKVICRDEMFESVDDALFEQQLWAMRDHVFDTALTEAQVDLIRWRLFPEIRIPTRQQSLFETVDEMSHTQRVRVMDAHQERLARSLKGGHRVIHGVSGSGKTLILTARARALAEMGLENILVICFNRTLEAWLREQLAQWPQVKVFSFFQWCRFHITHTGVQPGPFKEWPEQLCSLLDAGWVAEGQYDALLIDEGHDLEPDWIRLLVRMVRHAGDGARQELLFLYDDAQDLYGQGETARGVTFPLKEVGIQATGRTTVLRRNYRNTAEILRTAYGFLFEGLNGRLGEYGDILQPEAAGEAGAAPEIVEVPRDALAERVVARLRQWHEQEGVAWDEMAVLSPFTQEIRALAQALSGTDIPLYVALDQQKSAFQHHDGRVKLMTAHSAKGLEFEAVCVVGMERIEQADEDRRAGLVKAAYVAMTRAKQYLQVVWAHDGQA